MTSRSAVECSTTELYIPPYIHDVIILSLGKLITAVETVSTESNFMSRFALIFKNILQKSVIKGVFLPSVHIKLSVNREQNAVNA